MRVVVCDPGVGNVWSVARAVTRASGASHVEVSKRAEDVAQADVLVVPGQGSFGAFASAMKTPLGDAIQAKLASGAPYLGICLGMQVLFESSDEAPGARGLGLFRGHVRRLEPGLDPTTGAPWPLPHIGWNRVEPAGAWFYFAHSYVVVPENASLASGTTAYGDARFVSAIAKGPIVGVQFHPEKSQKEGLDLLARFFGGL